MNPISRHEMAAKLYKLSRLAYSEKDYISQFYLLGVADAYAEYSKGWASTTDTTDFADAYNMGYDDAQGDLGAGID